MTQNQANFAISLSLLAILALTTCVARDAIPATVDDEGRIIPTEEETKFCNDGGGCKLISEYQIDVLTRYVKQLEAALKEKECPKPETKVKW